MSVNTDTKGEGSSNKRKYIIIIFIIIGVVLIAAAGVIIYLLAKGQKPQASEEKTSEVVQEEKRDVLVTEDNVEEIIEQMKEDGYVHPGYYTVTQNYEWHFKNGKSESYDAHVENLPENTNDVYFDLFLEDDMEEAIYKSPIIPLGAVLENFKLDTELSAGTYDCVLVYNLTDEDQNSLGTVSVTVKVIVEN
jgi:hypothetical protein